MKLKRNQVKLGKLHHDTDNNYVQARLSVRVGLIWDLTREAWSLGGKCNVEQRLQRNVAVLKTRRR